MVERENELVFAQAMAYVIARHTWVGSLIGIGLSLIFVGMIFLIICLTTPFRENKRVTERRKNGIDFGYLKDLDETDIVKLFREDRLDQLARQVKQLSSVTWLKQLCLKLSAVAAGVGLNTIVVAYVAGIAALSD